ncbi:MAG TPA: HisA/HisF-related TIM barrel protein, partial [Burkholderiales bacterium]|nr:HisA/HisF-related TIM barrel protein [Burkholderiales bacterium]
IDLAKRYQTEGVEAIVYTDIGRDGMMSGVNVEATARLADSISIPVIASGGVSSLDDIKHVCKMAENGVVGAIVGRALYEGTLDFAAAQKLADDLSK